MLHSVYSNLLHIVAQKSIFHCIQVTVAKDLARNYADQEKKCWRKYGVLKKICNTRSGCCCGDGGQPAIRLMQEGEWLVSAEVCSSTEYYLMFFARLKESNKKDKGESSPGLHHHLITIRLIVMPPPYALISRKEDGISQPVTVEESS